MSAYLLPAFFLGVILRTTLYRDFSMPTLRHAWLFLLGVLAELFMVFLVVRGYAPKEVVVPLGEVVSYACILSGLWLNRSLPGIPLALLGGAMNALVIFANGGHMPVDPAVLERAGLGHLREALARAEDGLHVLAGEGTRLLFLGDWIPLPGRVVSPGDLLLVLGIFLWAMVPSRKGGPTMKP
uniref:DUF5317 domain-containing protein n=1 Tax=Thermus caliditerrae TaxID=1330700 RepID=A0A7C5VIW9_9DEIN